MQSRLDAAYAERARRSFFCFFKEFWNQIEAVELKLNWHIQFLCDELQQVYEAWERKESQPDVLINCPFGVSKSTILQLFEAWVTLRCPSVKILGTSYSAKISTKNAGKARMCLKSQKFQQWYPGRVAFDRNNDGKTEFANLAKGIYYTASTGGTATGQHSDFIFNDDPLSAKDANSIPKRTTANDFLGETLSSRKTDKERTVTVTVMQRLHQDDPSGHLLAKKPDLNHICLPAELTTETRALVKPAKAIALYEAHDNLLDPVRFNRQVMQNYKVELGPYGYAAQVLQNPSDTSSGIFKKDWFQTITWEDFQRLTANQEVEWHFDADTALTANTKNDPTALLASCYVDNTLFVRESYAAWLEYEDLLNFIPKFLERNGYDPVRSQLYLEPKANGKSVFQSFTKRGNVNVVEAPAPTDDKVKRAHFVVPFCASKRVVFIDGSYIHSMQAELFAFPNAAHDDRVDTLTQALQRHLAPAKKQRAMSF
ncbi:phage terminase large subunit [Hymenobacter sp. UYCo722]|uniref:phage terminase large subunit n=1 Tax=Hymenobacter sp. UYCo722 TaxID=3156335 RepID=UPI00339A761D